MKVFLTCLAVVFILVIFQRLGVKPPEIKQTKKVEVQNYSIPEKIKIDPFEEVKPKLQEKTNNFELKKPISFASNFLNFILRSVYLAVLQRG